MISIFKFFVSPAELIIRFALFSRTSELSVSIFKTGCLFKSSFCRPLRDDDLGGRVHVASKRFMDGVSAVDERTVGVGNTGGFLFQHHDNFGLGFL